MSQTFGNNTGMWGGSSSININCGNGYLRKIRGSTAGNYLRNIGGECNNGTRHGPFGAGGRTRGLRSYVLNCPDGFTGADVRSGDGVDAIAPVCGTAVQNPIGGAGGGLTQFRCPAGQVLKAIGGKNKPGINGYIGQISLTCGPKEGFEPFCGYLGPDSMNGLRLLLILIVIILIVWWMKNRQ